MRVEVQEIKRGETVFFSLGKEPGAGYTVYRASYLGLNLLGPNRWPAHQVRIEDIPNPKSGFKTGDIIYLNAKETRDSGVVHPEVQLYSSLEDIPKLHG